MAVYTQEEALQICTRYRPAILKQVERYYNTKFPMISGEDLLQEGTEAILIYLKKHNKDMPVFFPALDVKEKILLGIQSSLPLSYGRNKRELSKRISEAEPTLALKEELLGSETEDELVFQADLKSFLSKLTVQERNVFDLVAQGYGWEEAARLENVPRSSVYRMRSKMKKRYKQMMQ